jgi:cytochrome d ubiquinol oxidase subunit I
MELTALLLSRLQLAFTITGACYLLRRQFHAEAAVMLHMGLYLVAVLMPLQLFFGHLTGGYVHDRKPATFAPIEGRWHAEQPASEVLFAIPDERAEGNRSDISIPVPGGLIGGMSFSSKEVGSKEVGLTDFPAEDRPPVAISFFAFRIMVGWG